MSRLKKEMRKGLDGYLSKEVLKKVGGELMDAVNGAYEIMRPLLNKNASLKGKLLGATEALFVEGVEVDVAIHTEEKVECGLGVAIVVGYSDNVPEWGKRTWVDLDAPTENEMRKKGMAFIRRNVLREMEVFLYVTALEQEAKTKVDILYELMKRLKEETAAMGWEGSLEMERLQWLKTVEMKKVEIEEYLTKMKADDLPEAFAGGVKKVFLSHSGETLIHVELNDARKIDLCWDFEAYGIKETLMKFKRGERLARELYEELKIGLESLREEGIDFQALANGFKVKTEALNRGGESFSIWVEWDRQGERRHDVLMRDDEDISMGLARASTLLMAWEADYELEAKGEAMKLIEEVSDGGKASRIRRKI